MNWCMQVRRCGSVGRAVHIAALGILLLAGCNCSTDDGFTVVFDQSDVYAAWPEYGDWVSREEPVDLPAIEYPECTPEEYSETVSTESIWSRYLTLDSLVQSVTGSAVASTDSLVDVVVLFEDTLSLPALPDIQSDPSLTALHQSLILGVKQSRMAFYRPLIDTLVSRHGAEVLTPFWIVSALELRVSKSELPDIAGRPDVVSIEPSLAGTSAPSCNALPANPTVADARNVIGGGPLYDLPSGDEVALLDVGVRSTHNLLGGRIAGQYNCVIERCCNCGSSDPPACCGQPDPVPCCDLADPTVNDPACFPDCQAVQTDLQDCYHCGHGTSSAAILTGTDAMGDRYRGLTDRLLQVYGVYWKFDGPCDSCLAADTAQTQCLHENDCGGLVRPVVGTSILGFQTAVNLGARLIVAVEALNPAIITNSRAADNAYDLNTAVVAANGNRGPNPKTVRSPALAHKSLGIGAFTTPNGPTTVDQSRGPTADCRVKPDIQLTTQTETAGSPADGNIHSYGGTSAATAYAGGVLALVRTAFLQYGGRLLPGYLYAGMIVFGNYSAGRINNEVGAGLVNLPQTSILRMRRINIAARQAIELPFQTRTNAQQLDAALWWPEADIDTHRKLSLAFVDPQGNVTTAGQHPYSVFQRIRNPATPTRGQWRALVVNESDEAQEVFLAVHVHKSGLTFWERVIYTLRSICTSIFT